MPNRRQLNAAVDQMRRATARDHGVGRVKTRLNDPEQAPAVLAALFDLDVECQDPQCQHALGFHYFGTPAMAAPCNWAGCGCRDFQRTPPMQADPFAGLSEPEPPTPQPLTASAFVDGLDEPDAPEPMTPIGAIAREAYRTATVRVSELPPEYQPVCVQLEVADNVTHLSAYEGISYPVGAADPDEASTPVRFPVLVAGVNSVALADLQTPAQRVAEIVEALEPVLAPPPVVADLVALVARANAHEVTDAASYAAGTELYELLAANEKGIEETITPVVAFFHRPWKALCEFRARFARPVAEAKTRLSDVCGAWKLAADKAAAVEAQRVADQAAADERVRLQEIADAAFAAAAAAPAASPVRQVLEQTAVQATEQKAHVVAMGVGRGSAAVPGAASNDRKAYEAVVVDEDRFYLALGVDVDRVLQRVAELPDRTSPADWPEAMLVTAGELRQILVEASGDKTRRYAAPIDLAYLHRQAKDLKTDLAKRFPGIEAREKGGLTAKGRR